MGKKDQCQLFLTKIAYRAGEKVEGIVEFELTKPTIVTEVRVLVIGTESFEELSGGRRMIVNKSKVGNKNEETHTFRREKFPIAKINRELKAGLHKFPFHFSMPITDPGTYQENWEHHLCKVMYEIRGRVDIEGAVPIEGKAPLRLVPAYPGHIKGFGVVNRQVCCWPHKESAQLAAEIEQSMYTAGTDVRVTVKISNDGGGADRPVVAINARLVSVLQNTVLRGDRGVFFVDDKPVEAECHVGAGETVVTTIKLHIPKTAAASFNGTLFSLSHEIKVKAILGSKSRTQSPAASPNTYAAIPTAPDTDCGPRPVSPTPDVPAHNSSPSPQQHLTPQWSPDATGRSVSPLRAAGERAISPLRAAGARAVSPLRLLATRVPHAQTAWAVTLPLQVVIGDHAMRVRDADDLLPNRPYGVKPIEQAVKIKSIPMPHVP